MRILLAEDDAPVASFVRKGLEAEHYAVDVASDGEEAQFMIDEFSFDLVILDLNLPRADGLEVLKHVRARKTSVPILVLTARSAIEDRVKGLDLGADDYLSTGGTGNDTLRGEAGNDVVVGGAGKDVLCGGGGADTFLFCALSDSAPGSGADVISDFSAPELDKINLAAIDANAALAGDQAFSFIGSDAFHGVAGELRFASGAVEADVNGDGTADFSLTIANLSALAAGDFIL